MNMIATGAPAEELCFPYYFSNDNWYSGEDVANLNVALEAETTPQSEAGALILGPGAVPYVAARLGVSKIVVADLHQSVIDLTLERTAMVHDYDDWDDYHAAVTDKLHALRMDECELNNEIGIAKQLNLLDNYALTKARLASLDIEGFQGDIRETAPSIGAAFRAEGKQVSFVNLTNVSARLPGHKEALGKAVRSLPLAPEAVIIDTSDGNLKPQFYSPHSYPGIARRPLTHRLGTWVRRQQ